MVTHNEIIGLEDWVETREEMDNKFVALVEKYVGIPELPPTIVNEFIKKIRPVRKPGQWEGNMIK